MENYERPQEYYDTKEEIELWKEDDWWIISHKGMNVTTQGKTRLEALLMLADAISGYKNSDEDLVEMSQEVFIPDEDMIEFMDEMTDN
jgi:predicted RNase H-like HicB family nuclease